MTDLTIVEDGTCIDIGECGLDTDADIALGEAYADLNDEERARAARFVFPHDRDRFVRAHGYLRRQLGTFIGVPPIAVSIASKEGAKPLMEGAGPRFSLSHSGSRAVVAITASHDVGIDLEIMDRANGLDGQLDDLARACLTSAEQAALAVLPPEQRTRRFLSYWTAKEARMKLTGEGMTLEPQAIALQLSNGRAVGYLRPPGPRAHLRFVPLASPDSICCLAVGLDTEPGG